jgi:hypothetical protein
MDILKPVAVIGTNAWGGKLYGKAIRGSYVTDEVIKELEEVADSANVKIMGSDLFRPFVLKEKTSCR